MRNVALSAATIAAGGATVPQLMTSADVPDVKVHVDGERIPIDPYLAELGLTFRDLTLGYGSHPAVHHLSGAVPAGAPHKAEKA